MESRVKQKSEFVWEDFANFRFSLFLATELYNLNMRTCVVIHGVGLL